MTTPTAEELAEALRETRDAAVLYGIAVTSKGREAKRRAPNRAQIFEVLLRTDDLLARWDAVPTGRRQHRVEEDGHCSLDTDIPCECCPLCEPVAEPSGGEG